MEDKKNTAAETFAENIDTYGNDNDVIMDLEEDEVEKVYPCIPLRGVSIFPNTVIHLIPTFSDVYNMGCIVKVKQMLKINGDAVRVLVSGVCRAKLSRVVS